jgi:hypothetical protein
LPTHSKDEADSARPCSDGQLIAFRFSFVYSLLYLAASRAVRGRLLDIAALDLHGFVGERSGLASVHLMNGKILDHFTSLDTLGYRIQFLANTDTTLTVAGATRLAYNPATVKRRVRTLLEEGASAPITLAYPRTSPNELALTGRWAGDTIAARLRRIDESQFLLRTKGIRWVQSYPYFR